MNQFITILIFSLISQVSCAQKTLLHVVKTKNGTAVNLYSDNTWDYANATPSQGKMSAISYKYGTATEGKGSAGNKTGSTKKANGSRKPSSGRVYHTGPRGGCYYYTAGGSKVYVDRSYCN
ncbi:hypothetical protein U0035_21385 [Niabella yanshanensis]|uniref:PBCV-specific basic adaptor domain-containing protein n=1 Tax=Niabella yanshanensis TaxID=577386 RepID=A0ABZ0W4S6_9BACT|nr:hypothetical protein [Niabella yanshanensis]WQD38227.1 hypothetical protein U0035_21385 [Niabella yanshanensis]